MAARNQWACDAVKSALGSIFSFFLHARTVFLHCADLPIDISTLLDMKVGRSKNIIHNILYIIY